MIVRAYFVLGVEPGSAGLVPVLREVPEDDRRRDGGHELPPRRPDPDRRANRPVRPRRSRRARVCSA